MIWKVIARMAAAFLAGGTESAGGQIGQGAYHVAIVGDSLATGAGIALDQSYPVVIQQLALNERWPIRITVHAANGETTADGLGRMNGILQGKPDVIVLALGANDGLRSIAPEEIRQNRAACETPGACGLAQSSILLVNTHLPWIADWMPALEDRRHAERWK